MVCYVLSMIWAVARPFGVAWIIEDGPFEDEVPERTGCDCDREPASIFEYHLTQQRLLYGAGKNSDCLRKSISFHIF